MNTITTNSKKDTIYRLRMNKQKKTIDIDVFYLDTVVKEIHNRNEYVYMYTVSHIEKDDKKFNDFYYNFVSFIDVYNLVSQIKSYTVQYKNNHRIKL